MSELAKIPQPNPPPRPQHWLVAAWPGMAGVAHVAAAHLIKSLGLKPVGDLPPHDHFDIQAVQVKGGVVGKPRLPQNRFYSGPLAGVGTHLTVFVGEAQPSFGAYGFAHELLARAREMGVDRIVTFASCASQLHPLSEPTVFGAATRRGLLEGVDQAEIKPLEEAQIGGLNGVILGAAAHRGMDGLCLLGEIPFFAAQIQNPKAARAVLDAFGELSGVRVNLDELSEQSAKVDQVLVQILERMQAGQGGQGGQGGEIGPEPIAPAEFDIGEANHDEIAASARDEPATDGANAPARALDMASREKIEQLFEAARKDRSQGVALKSLLDQLGVYAKYEDRFLDLFRRTE